MTALGIVLLLSMSLVLLVILFAITDFLEEMKKERIRKKYEGKEKTSKKT